MGIQAADAIVGALADAGTRLVQVNWLRTQGAKGYAWDSHRENFEALHQVGYNGWMVVEAFGLALPELAAATKIWRRMYQSEEQLSRDSLAFMKAQVAKRWR